eukprot:7158726-Ditylum_brightwellii.AAC.1
MQQITEGAYWEELLPKVLLLKGPTNAFQACASTVPEEDHGYAPQKCSLNFTMERRSFTGKVKTKLIKRYGWKRLSKVTYELRDHIAGKPCPIFITNNNINMHNNSAEWFYEFCPDKLQQEEKSFERFCVAECTASFNLNASLHNAGNMTYDTFTNFTPQ